MDHRFIRGSSAIAVALLLLLGACSSDGEGGTDDEGTTATSATSAADTTSTTEAGSGGLEFDPSAVATATVEPPPVEGNGDVVLLPPGLDVSTVGYDEAELFVSGTATNYTSAEPLASDGRWTAEPDETAPYTTRIIVRRPADDADFNGTVYVEWMNVTSGLDIAPDWTFGHVEMIREGAIWVGVTAQVVGIEGAPGPGQALALQGVDPERYGSLEHPGDDYSYDMFSQVGAAVRTQPDVLGGLVPDRVIALGESQSASRLTTYVNAVAPLANTYDAYLLHSRGGGSAPLQAGTRVSTRDPDQPEPVVPTPSPTLVRDDLTVPVMVLSSETDVAGDRLGYRAAQQPDTDLFRSWEVAGTAHLDAYGLGIGDMDDGSGAADTAAFEAMSDPPDTAYFGFVVCEQGVNAGGHTYVVRAALHHLDAWVRTGTPPPTSPLLEVSDDGSDYVRDDAGNALGGIRTPHVDVPIARLAGSGQTGETFCFLFGVTEPFDDATLAARYPDHETFVSAWNDATDAAVEAGFILEVDGERLKEVAAASTIGD